MGKAIFITGTGTDVGKTYVSGLIVKKLHEAGFNAGYYKAALSGANEDEAGNLLPGDSLYVEKVAGINKGASEPKSVSYVYREAVSPHLAAKWNSNPLDLDVIKSDFAKAKGYYELLTVEGSGGIICPLRWDDEVKLCLDDMVTALGLGVILVADSGLGTINSTVLTTKYLNSRSIAVKGIILNNWTGSPMQEDNKMMIEELSKARVIATVSANDENIDVDANILSRLYE